MTTESFAHMCDCIYDLNWPHLSIALQKSIIMMIKSMQKPTFYHGFKIVTLDLNTLIRVSLNSIESLEQKLRIECVFIFSYCEWLSAII